jgi:dienelactone hydrolase
VRALLVCVCVLLAVATGVAAQPAGTEIAIPMTTRGLFGEKVVTLVATEYRPAGAGPFPAIVLSHGSTGALQERVGYTARYPVASDVFVKWGFVVLNPLRRGYGKTGGVYEEGYGSCANPGYVDAGLETAQDIAAALAYVTQQPYVDRERLVLVGQSGGGWGSLAAASRGDLPIRGVVNFAGGRGGKQRGIPNNNCTPERLVEAAGTFARTTRVPSLWLYTENDRFFGPDLSRQLHRAYSGNGGHARFHLLPAIGQDGHTLINLRSGVPLWRDKVAAFLRKIGVLPGS